MPRKLAVLALIALAPLALPASAQDWTKSKWGPSDEIGSANYMTPELVLKAAQLIKTGNSGAPFVSTISTYVPDIIRYFEHGSSMLNYDTPGGKYTRILTIVSDESIGGKGEALNLQRNAYPDPGETDERGQ